MNPRKVVAVVGTYRKGGIVDSAVDEILAAAAEAGAETSKVYLIDRHIEFCTNCRTCTQEREPNRGACPVHDDLAALLDEIEEAGALVLASPMNFWTVTAVTKKFIERLVCFSYWPWGAAAPKIRENPKDKRAIVVASSAAPALMARLSTRMVGLMKQTVALLGAKSTDVLFIGLSATDPHQQLSSRTVRKARRLGKRLVVS